MKGFVSHFIDRVIGQYSEASYKKANLEKAFQSKMLRIRYYGHEVLMI